MQALVQQSSRCSRAAATSRGRRAFSCVAAIAVPKQVSTCLPWRPEPSRDELFLGSEWRPPTARRRAELTTRAACHHGCAVLGGEASG